MIVNQLGRTAFTFRPSEVVEGQPCEGLEVVARPYPLPLRREIWTLTVGGDAADGDYSATFVPAGSPGFTLAFARAAGEGNDAIAAAWASALLAAASRKGVIQSATVSGAVITMISKHPGIAIDVVGAAPVGATFLASEIVSAEGEPLKVGRFVVGATLEGLASVAAPGNAASAASLLGVILRPHTGITRRVPALADDEPTIEPGSLVAPATSAIVCMRNVGGDAADNGLVHVVRNTAGGQERGQARGTADGGNTIALPIARGRWLAPTAAGELGPVMINL